MGILGPLSRRVGARGKVVGMDIDPKLIDAARVLGKEEGWNNVELRDGDALQTHLTTLAHPLDVAMRARALGRLHPQSAPGVDRGPLADGPDHPGPPL